MALINSSYKARNSFLFLLFLGFIHEDTVGVGQEGGEREGGGHAANKPGQESNPGRCHKD